MTSDSVSIGIGIAVIVLFLMFYMIVLAYAVVCYILGSKGLYAIAARRGIKNPWMAWIPVVGNWTLGYVSDQYSQRKYGEDPKLRIKLLIFSIITQSSMIPLPILGNISVNFDLGDWGGPDGTMVGAQVPEAMKIVLIVFMVLIMILAMAALVLSIIQMVYQYKAYYNLYASCKPKFAVLFLVLSIVTPAGPFLTYACRNSDDGMPVQTEI